MPQIFDSPINSLSNPIKKSSQLLENLLTEEINAEESESLPYNLQESIPIVLENYYLINKILIEEELVQNY